MRLGDLDALIAEYDKVHVGEAGKARHLMETAPTIDAVPVVRCKDCKHYQTEDWDGNVLCGCTLPSAMLDITPDGYCSYGERKEDEK